MTSSTSSSASSVYARAAAGAAATGVSGRPPPGGGRIGGAVRGAPATAPPEVGRPLRARHESRAATSSAYSIIPRRYQSSLERAHQLRHLVGDAGRNREP